MEAVEASWRRGEQVRIEVAAAVTRRALCRDLREARTILERVQDAVDGRAVDGHLHGAIAHINAVLLALSRAAGEEV